MHIPCTKYWLNWIYFRLSHDGCWDHFIFNVSFLFHWWQTVIGYQSHRRRHAKCCKEATFLLPNNKSPSGRKLMGTEKVKVSKYFFINDNVMRNNMNVTKPLSNRNSSNDLNNVSVVRQSQLSSIWSSLCRDVVSPPNSYFIVPKPQQSPFLKLTPLSWLYC